MIFCTACRYASPPGSVYCPRCTRSLNCRLCDKGHRNGLSPAILACHICQSLSLSEGAVGIPLGWVSSLLTLIVVVFVWKALLAHAPAVLSFLGQAMLEGSAFLLNTRSACLAMFLREILAWIVVLWLLGHSMNFLPGKGGNVGTWLRGLPFLLLRRTGALAGRTVRWLLWRTRRLFWSSENSLGEREAKP